MGGFAGTVTRVKITGEPRVVASLAVKIIVTDPDQVLACIKALGIAKDADPGCGCQEAIEVNVTVVEAPCCECEEPTEETEGEEATAEETEGEEAKE